MILDSESRIMRIYELRGLDSVKKNSFKRGHFKRVRYYNKTRHCSAKERAISSKEELKISSQDA